MASSKIQSNCFFLLCIICQLSLLGQSSHIGIAKSGMSTGREVSYLFTLESFGPDTLKSISVIDDLDAVFGAGNYSLVGSPTTTGTLSIDNSYDGTSSTQLLLPTSFLAPEASATIEFSVSINTPTDQGSGLGIYTNQVTATAMVGEMMVSDLSDDGVDPDPNENNDPTDEGEDDPTSVNIFENPRIGISKNATSTDSTITYVFYIENFGNTALTNISIIDDLNEVFMSGNFAVTSPPTFLNDPGTLTLNGSYDGNTNTELIAAGTLAVGDDASFSIDVKVLNIIDIGFGQGIYRNQVEATAQSSSGKTTEDLSDYGVNPDPNNNNSPGDTDEQDFTTIVIGQEPIIGLSKTASVLTNGNVQFDYYIENFGNTALSDISIIDDLESVFGAGNFNVQSISWTADPLTILLNPNFDGYENDELIESGGLAVGATGQLSVIVENIILSDQGMGSGNYSNQAVISARSSQGVSYSDLSDDGTDPDPNGNGNPNESDENDATTFSISEIASIGIAKEFSISGEAAAGPIVRLIFHVENFGNVPISNITITDNLNSVYGVGTFVHITDPSFITGAPGFNFNLSFNGGTNTSMLNAGSTLHPGESVSFYIEHLVTNITDQGFGTGIYQNQVTLSGEDPDGAMVSDLSTEGSDPDPNGNNDPSDAEEGEPTVIDITGSSKLGIAKDTSVSGNQVTFDLYLENLGSLQINDLGILENLDVVFGAGNYTIVSPPTFVDDPGSILLNNAFDGSTNQDLLDISNSSLAAGETAQIQFIVEVDNITNQGFGIGSYSSQSFISGESTVGLIINDASDFGTDPDPNGNGNPNEAGENDATIFSLSVDPIGVAKTASVSGPSVTFDLYIENLGTSTASNISLIDNLDDTFGAGNYTITSAPTLINDPGTLVLNSNYDGSSDTELLSMGSTLNVGSTGQIRLIVNVDQESDQGSGFGIYQNQAIVSGESPSGLRFSDFSDDGTDPDPNGNNDPSDAGEEDATSVVISTNPAIGVVNYAIVSGTEVTLFWEVENIGEATLNNVLLELPLNPIFGSGNYSISQQPTLVSGPNTLLFSPQFFGFSVFDFLVVGGYIRPGETVVFSVKVNVTNVTDQGNGLGVYNIGATISANAPDGSMISDVSDADFMVDPDNDNNANEAGENDPLTVTIGDEANIGAALDVQVVGNLVTFDYYLENLGTSILSDLMLVNDYDDLFGAGNYTIDTGPTFVNDPGTITLNGGFDGSSSPSIITLAGSTLGATGVAQIRVVVQVDNLVDNGLGLGIYENQFEVSATAPLGSSTMDVSDDGVNPDPNGNSVPFDDGENDSSIFQVGNTAIGVAKNVDIDCDVVTFDYYLQNLGTNDLDSIELIDDFDALFGADNFEIVSGPSYEGDVRLLVLNDSFDGSEDTQILLPSSSINGVGIEHISVQVRVTNILGTPYSNNAIVRGKDEFDFEVQDISDFGNTPDFDMDGFAGEVGEDDPTIFSINSLPAVIADNNSTICPNTMLQLTESGGDGVAWFWSGPNNFISMDQNPVINSLGSDGEGEYTVIVTDTDGCLDSMTTIVTLFDAPDIMASSNSSVCKGDTIKLFEFGGDAQSWLWTGPDGFVSILQEPNSIASSTAKSGTYKVVITDSNSCQDSAEIQVVIDTVKIEVASNSSICKGEDILLEENGGEATSWNWTGPNGFNSTDEDPTQLAVSTAFTGTYEVVVSDGTCTDSAEIQVVIDTVKVELTSNSSVCKGEDILLEENGGEATSWNWTGPNGFNSTDEDPIQNAESTAFTGTYEVVVNDGTCTDSAEIQVVIDTVKIEVASNSSICKGEDILLEENGGEATSWNWTGPNGFNSTDEDPTQLAVSTAFTGTYEVVVSDGTCTDSAEIQVVIDTVKVELTSNSSVCKGEDILLEENGGEATSWNWTGPNGFNSTDEDPIQNAESTAFTGTYEVVVSDGTCTDSAEIQVVIDTVKIEVASNSSICKGEDILLEENGGEATSWNWTGPNGFNSTDEDPTQNAESTAFTGTYEVVVSDGTCTDSAEIQVVIDTVKIEVASNSSICKGEDILLEENGGEATSWNWTGPNGFNSTDEDPTQNAESTAFTGTYEVVVNDGTCTDSAEIQVVIDTVKIEVASNSSICKGEDILLEENGGEATSWNWTGPNGFNSTDEDPTQNAESTAFTGTYEVVVNDGTCTDSAEIQVVIDTVKIEVASNSSICKGEDILLEENGGEATSWIWTGPNGFNSTDEDPTQNAESTAFTGTYEVVVSDGTCTDSAEIQVVIDTVKVAISVDEEICADQNLILSESGGEAINWFWTGPESYSSTQELDTITNIELNQAGVYQVKVEGANGCVDSLSSMVIVNSKPLVNVQLNGMACEGSDILLEEIEEAGVNYSWTGPNDFMASGVSTIISMAALSDGGSYNVTVEDSNGCIDSNSIDIAIMPLPILNGEIEGPALVCENLEDLSYIASMGQNTDDYIWDYTGVFNNADIVGSEISIDNFSTSGELSVRAENICGLSLDSLTLQIDIGPDELCELTGCVRENIHIDNDFLALTSALEIYQVSNTLTSDALIKAGKMTIFRAGNEIILFGGDDEFEVEKGAVFIADIIDCFNR